MRCRTSSLQGIRVKILVLEPYYGGSHQTFLDGLQTHVPFDFFLLTLPARNWKWRMRLAAPYFADNITALYRQIQFDAVLCSSFVDVAALRSLLPAEISQLPFYSYFHENQFAYPVRKEDERDFHFGLTNLTTVMASDLATFNTAYNLQTFLQGVKQIRKICPDMELKGIMGNIIAKSCVLSPGIDFCLIDEASEREIPRQKVPVIVWNHRWEHDKNPQYFFETLFALDKEGVDFRLIVLGQTFRTKPAVFSEASLRLQDKIIHFGFAESRQEYARLLQTGDIVVSTAKHEFYGIAVIEAVRAGCYPLLPTRLSYPELFSPEYLYADEELPGRLRSLLHNNVRLDKERARALTERFSWAALMPKYMQWLSTPPVMLEP
jgi:glycosyltransferase involved in cell wall biosynthesis